MILNLNFGHHPSFGSKDSVKKRKFGQNLIFESATATLKIRSRSSKPHKLFSLSKQFICMRLVKSTLWFRKYVADKADFAAYMWLTLKIR